MPTPVYVLSKPTIASMMVDSGASSAPTVLVVGVGVDEVVDKAPVSSTSPAESTQLILNPAASQGSAFPGSAPQDIPRLDSGITSNVDSAQVNAFYTNDSSLCLFSVFMHLASKNRSCIYCNAAVLSIPVYDFFGLFFYLFIFFKNFMDDGPSRGTRRSRRARVKTERGIL